MKKIIAVVSSLAVIAGVIVFLVVYTNNDRISNDNNDSAESEKVQVAEYDTKNDEKDKVLVKIEKDDPEYSRLDPLGKYTLYKDAAGVVYFADSKNFFRVIMNTAPQDAKDNADANEAVKYYLGITGQDVYGDDVFGKWTEDAYSKEYILSQQTDFGEIVLADMIFDKQGNFISGNFEPDGYYNGEESVLSEKEMEEMALEYVKEELGEEYFDKFKANYTVSFTPVGTLKGRIIRTVMLSYGDDMGLKVGDRPIFGYSIKLDAKTGELVAKGYLR